MGQRVVPSSFATAEPICPCTASGFEVGESSSDEKYHKLLKHYHEVRALLCASRLHANMLLGDLVVARAALVVAQQEAA